MSSALRRAGRLAAGSLAAALPITVILFLLGDAWGKHLMAHPEVVDQQTALGACVRAVEALYMPAVVGTILLSPNVHQPSDVAAFVAMLAQTFLMVFLGAAIVAWARTALARRRRP